MMWHLIIHGKVQRANVQGSQTVIEAEFEGQYNYSSLTCPPFSFGGGGGGGWLGGVLGVLGVVWPNDPW
jgi:hypothetical protein